MRAIKALGALIVLAFLVAGPPWALVTFIGNPWPPESVSLSAPLTDDAIIGLLAVIVWLLWAQLIACILAEAIAAATEDRIRIRVPLTLEVQRHLARRLVTVLAVLAVSSSVSASTAAATHHPTAPTPRTPAAASATAQATGVTAATDAATTDAMNGTTDVAARAQAASRAHEATEPATRPALTQPHSRGSAMPRGRMAPTQPRGYVSAPSAAAVTDDRGAGTGPGDAASIEGGTRGGLRTVTVMRLDSLWSIAERVLGEGERWPEIAELNEGRTMSDGTTFVSADYIRPGWTLRVPSSAQITPGDQGGTGSARNCNGASAHKVVVEEGDTLSQIALDELGDATAYPEIFEASTPITQPGGRHLVDPDAIDVGWTVRIPAPETQRHPAPGSEAEHGAAPGTASDPGAPPTSHHHGQQNPQPDSEQDSNHGSPQDAQASAPLIDLLPGLGAAPPLAVPSVQPASPSSTSGHPIVPSSPVTEDAQTPEPADNPDRGAAASDEPSSGNAETVDRDIDEKISVLRALLATAVCLSAGALGLVALNRRRQFRRRRIGRTIASTPAALVDVEQAIIETGSQRQADVEFLDLALRHIATSCRLSGSPLPQLGAAVLADDELTLLFTQPATTDAPEGWNATEDDCAWTRPRLASIGDHLAAQAAPYPALVTVGQDQDGRTWLLNLETVGVCGISGDPNGIADLTRFLVAELAVNRWSEGVEVLLADGFGAETVGLNPARVRQIDRGAALARAALLTDQTADAEQNLTVDIATRRRDGTVLDTTSPVVLVTAARPQSAFVTAIEERGLSRVVILHGAHAQGAELAADRNLGPAAAASTAPMLELAEDESVFLPAWEIRLQGFLLRASEAEAMAALLATTRDFADVPVPNTASEDGTLGKYARADGSLREAYTAPRRPVGTDPSSQLPEADEVYLASGATTSEDLAAAAPSLHPAARAEIEAIDPNLDQDLADWLDPSSARPKIHLLGPVEVTSRNGGAPEAIDNLAGTVSFIAYLACQDRGVTGERAALACGWKTQRTVQNRASNARFLLGNQPDGSDWIPDASMSEGARRGSAPTYELATGAGGVLNSADLFVRLRFRAQRRGDDCEHDLVAALSLVTGAPFEAATEHRFRWLFQPGQQRYDEILVGAIHDAAHLLATRALAAGKPDLVRLACDVANKASPYSDIAWLDQAALTATESGHNAASDLVRTEVLDRFDEDIPPRSETVIERRKWGATG